MALNKKHKYMLEQIESDAEFTAAYTGRRHFTKRVMNAMAEVLRENFVPADLQRFAYDNEPLPIGHEQTIRSGHLGLVNI